MKPRNCMSGRVGFPRASVTVLAAAVGMAVCSMLTTVLTACGNDGVWSMDVEECQGLGVNTTRFEKNDMAGWGLLGRTELSDTDVPFLITGDITGNNDYEIVLADYTNLVVYGIGGHELRRLDMQDRKIHSAVCGDLDRDGKDDIIVGAFGGQAARVIAFNGTFAEILDESFDEMIDGNTTVHFVKDGRLYFSGYSQLAVVPKIVAALDGATRERLWTYYSGPLPLDVSANADGTILTLSDRGHSKEGLVREENPSGDSKFKARLVLLAGDGEVRYSEPMGPDTRNGYFVEEGISRLTTRLFDLDGDGTDELIAAIGRISELYVGPSELRIYAWDGEETRIQAKREFDPETEIGFSVVSHEGTMYIVAVSRTAGKVSLLEPNLKTVGEWESPAEGGITVLREIGDYDGDGEPEICVTSHNRLVFLDMDLQVEFETAVPWEITDVAIPAGKRPEVWVLGNHILRFGPTEDSSGTVQVWTDPPGARVYVDGEEIDPERLPQIRGVKPGDHLIRAELDGEYFTERRITVEAGRVTEVSLELEGYGEEAMIDYRGAAAVQPAPSPERPIRRFEDLSVEYEMEYDPGYGTLWLIRDIVAGPEKDLIFHDSGDCSMTVTDLQGNYIRRFYYPTRKRNRSFHVQAGDVNRDSKQDLLMTITDPIRVWGVNGDGRSILYKEFGDWPNCAPSNALFYDNVLYTQLITGYILSPRGVFGFDTATEEILFYYPTATTLSSTPVHRDGKMYLASYTPTNDISVEYPTGLVNDDGRFFVHIVDTEGNQLPTSFPVPGDGSHGLLCPLQHDVDGDGHMEVLYTAGKNEYYPGTGQLLLLNEEEHRLEVLYNGPEDSIPVVQFEGKCGGERIYAVTYHRMSIVDLLDEEFSLIRRLDLPELMDDFVAASVYWADLDGDGETELYCRGKNSIHIFDPHGDPIHRIPVPVGDGRISRFEIIDYDGDGRLELNIAVGSRIWFFGY